MLNRVRSSSRGSWLPAPAVVPAVAPAVATDLLRLRLAAGVVTVDEPGLSERCRRAVRVALAVGAPVLDAIDGAAAAEDDERRAVRATAVASAQTRLVATVLVAAPLLLVPGLARLVGADLTGFYLTGIGAVVLLAGASLLATGAGIVIWLVRRVARPAPPRGQAATGPRKLRAVVVAMTAGWLAWRVVGPALAPLAGIVGHHLASRRTHGTRRLPGLDEAADLVAAALAGGVSAPHALRLAAAELPSLADPLRRLAFDLELGLAAPVAPGPVDEGLARLRAVLVTATQVGAAAAPTLRRLASDLRADDLARRLAAAERLPAQLTFPTALCLLPATILLIGAPIVHAGLAAAGT